MSPSIYEIFCLMCCPPWPPKIAEKIVFQPPTPSYFFGFVTNRFQLFSLDSTVAISQDWPIANVECLHTTSSRGNRIACVMVRCTERGKYTILFSHGNAADLGLMCSFYYDLGTLIDCDIFSYDYSGYGASSGKPSEKNLYADIECAWEAMQSHYHIPPSQIILYGMSLGSVPTIDLASRHGVGAVILHSPLTSALRVIKPNLERTTFCDSFVTIEKVRAISSPVLVIHGTEDEIVPFSHGVTIYENCECRVPPLWVEGAGHNDIEQSRQYLERLKLFVHCEIEQYTLAMAESKVEREQSFKPSIAHTSTVGGISFMTDNEIHDSLIDTYVGTATREEPIEYLGDDILMKQCTSEKECHKNKTP